ncbi:MAG: hypothetical protein RMX68_031455 [Aulosira sp. ZfuVER01]|nr:hypothetical protein [Aulosira sp. ZfuVER01]MDZ7998346.1 hypothetical protein [Aulosira sp. DedVER01a]MDZ8050123.1 hypothetical protein [Aulosira sp. ZfuCHP01]
MTFERQLLPYPAGTLFEGTGTLSANKSAKPTTVATTEGNSATHCLPNALAPFDLLGSGTSLYT